MGKLNADLLIEGKLSTVAIGASHDWRNTLNIRDLEMSDTGIILLFRHSFLSTFTQGSNPKLLNLAGLG
jgi:hypothetical protein